jgi:hypothetical protein
MTEPDEPANVRPSVAKYMAEIGSKGGAAATGRKKRRSLEHYQRMAEASAATRQAQAAERAANKPPVPPPGPRGRPRTSLPPVYTHPRCICPKCGKTVTAKQKEPGNANAEWFPRKHKNKTGAQCTGERSPVAKLTLTIPNR